MMDADHKQLRLANCVETIIQVQSLMNDNRLDQELINRFKQLESSLKTMEIKDISETDVIRVEAATNRLLNELSTYFKENQDGSICFASAH